MDNLKCNIFKSKTISFKKVADHVMPRHPSGVKPGFSSFTFSNTKGLNSSFRGSIKEMHFHCDTMYMYNVRKYSNTCDENKKDDKQENGLDIYSKLSKQAFKEMNCTWQGEFIFCSYLRLMGE